MPPIEQIKLTDEPQTTFEPIKQPDETSDKQEASVTDEPICAPPHGVSPTAAGETSPSESPNERHLRSPSVSRVLLEASLPLTTLPPPVAAFVHTNLHSPKASPSHHSQEERRARLIELARMQSAENQMINAVIQRRDAQVIKGDQHVIDDVTQVTEMKTQVLPPPTIIPTSEPSQIRLAHEAKSSVEHMTAVELPTFTSSVPSDTSSQVSSPSFERVSNQDVRVQDPNHADSSQPAYREREGRPAAHHRAPMMHRRSGGGGGGSGGWRSQAQSEVPFYQQSFMPTFTSSYGAAPQFPLAPSQMAYMAPGPISTGYDAIPLISNQPVHLIPPRMRRGSASRSQHSPLHIHSNGAHAVSQAEAHSSHETAHVSHDVSRDSSLSSSANSRSPLGRLRSSSISSETSSHARQSPVDHSSSSPISMSGHVVTVSPTQITSPLHPHHALVDPHAAAIHSPRQFYWEQQSQLHSLPVFDDASTESDAHGLSSDSSVESTSRQTEETIAEPEQTTA